LRSPWTENDDSALRTEQLCKVFQDARLTDAGVAADFHIAPFIQGLVHGFDPFGSGETRVTHAVVHVGKRLRGGFGDRRSYVCETPILGDTDRLSD
jgi:hypothetical protein